MCVHVRMCVFVCLHACASTPAVWWWAGTHVYPGGAPAARIALQRKVGQSPEALTWSLRGQPSYLLLGATHRPM